MPLRTADEYRAGLRDGREVYAAGARVPDVTVHPGLAIAVGHAANVYDLAHDAETRELFTFDLDGDTVSRYYEPLTTVEAIERRSCLVEEHTRRGRASLNLTKAVGTDALAALACVSAAADRAEGTGYGARVAAFRALCAHSDLSVVLAQTDVKGDRGLAPHEQEDPDAYVRIVERRSDGIVVQGAKAHTTMAPVADEVIVLPTRSLSEADADYAVAFAIPLATPGLRMICGPLPSPASAFDRPISSRNVEIESLTVFDRVLVPWERVFLAGEWRFAGPLATTFATYHRFTAISYKLPAAELLLGCAVLAAELNGTARASHVREKIARLVQYGELLRACVGAAARGAVPVEGGLLLPDPVPANVGKLHFASGYHGIVQIVQDLAGGLAITAPSEADLESPDTGPWVRKYLRGARGTDAELRLRLFNLIRDLTASDYGGYNLVVTLHGEGSLQAQLLQTLRDADLAPAVRAVANAIGVAVPAVGQPGSPLPLVR
jgi:aromatic ring hydroxylase